MKNDLETNTSNPSIQKLASLIKSSKFAMLTTINEEGELHSRPMATQQFDFDGDLWFLTGANTHKVFELNKNHQVVITYTSGDENRFVSVSGTGEVVKDRAKAEELWNPIHKAWFPKGLDDPELILLRVHVKKAEYWDSASNKLVQLFGFAKAVLTGKPHQGEGTDHQKLNISA